LTNGGIDLNQINFNRNGQEVNLQFDAAQISEITRPDFNGFRGSSGITVDKDLAFRSKTI